jgi:uncharacterized Zn-binding protein involved in type VI secretion
MPAAKQNDMVVGVDIHIVMVPSPGGPIPTPLPHPFSGKLDAALSTDVQIMGMAAAMVDSLAHAMPPHIPTPPGTAFQKPPKNEAKVFLGSATVLINGKPAARMGDKAMTCNDPSDLPIGTVIGTGATVMIGGPPSPAGSAAQGEEAKGSGSSKADSELAESTTSETETETAKDFVEFNVIQLNGDGLSGAEYELQLPGGEKKTGSLPGNGKLREDEIPVGLATMRLKGLHAAAWATKINAVDSDIEMAAQVAVYADGTPVKFEVYREFEEGDGDVVATVKANSKNGVATAKWKYKFEQRDKGKKARFVFHAVLDDYLAGSEAASIGDVLNATIKDVDGKPVIGLAYEILACDGERRRGTTGAGGVVEEIGLAFGPCTLRLSDGAVVKDVK